MAGMGTRRKCFPLCCTGWSHSVRRARSLPAAPCKKPCKSNWECGSVSVTSTRFEPRMDGATSPARRKKNLAGEAAQVEEGAGGLFLLATAHETGLLSQLEMALSSCEPTTPRSLLSSSPHCLRQLLLTLLFFPLGNVHRTHDLRTYTGNALAVVTGRH